MTYREVMRYIESLKREDYGMYNSRLEHDIALDKIAAVNETVDEVLMYLRTLSMQGFLIHN